MSNIQFTPTRVFSALLTCLLVTSCGGGGGDTIPPVVVTPPPVVVEPEPSVVMFTEVSTEAGLPNSSVFESPEMAEMMDSGVTVGDYNNDGWLDVYLVRYQSDNLLYKNNGDGTFSNVSDEAGVRVLDARGASASFADFDGDGWLDLFVSSFGNEQYTVFRNTQDGKFENVTASTGLDQANKASFSMAFGDYDKDGDNDMFVTHWKEAEDSEFLQYLWQNQGDGTFIDASASSGISAIMKAADVKSFTPNFTDVNNDGWLDLTIASDFGTSRLIMNNGGSFVDATTSEIDDENGMGSSMGDFDNDGDLDWFVTSVFEGEGTLRTGNKLYQNDGQGNYHDISNSAGVSHGHWGWGSCFADFDNDTNLDIFHVNGFGNQLSAESENLQAYYEDPSRLFMSNGDLTFTEKAVELGIDDTQQGRGIVCFDYDRDGDLDILISNFAQPLTLYRNNTGTDANYLGIKLTGKAPNLQGIGAKITIKVGDVQMMREIRNGNNYLSANPVEAHFGLGDATMISEVTVLWPDQTTTTMTDVTANQLMTIAHP